LNAQFKKPFNRKLTYVVAFSVLGLGILGVIALSLNDPRDAQIEAAREAEQRALERLPTGDEAAARRKLEDEIKRLQSKIASHDNEKTAREGFDEFMGAGNTVPGLDPEMLRLLDEAQREVNQSPEVARSIQRGAANPLIGSSRRGGGGDGAGGLVYDNYSKRQSVSADDDDDLFAHDNRADVGIYDTLRPRLPPSERIISQGSSIHTVLMSRIDTRNDGQIIAMVTRNVYDSKTMRMPLVPQGSRLVGEYSTNPTPGADRLEVNFNRLILPDGRAFDLPAFQSAGGDGTIGVKGKYRSNLLQAIGPSFLVAILGQAIDRQVKKEIPVRDNSVTPGFGGAYQSQSILEQITPQINQQIMQRYQGARPYFIIEPGQQLRVLLTEDVEVPEPNLKSGGVR